MSDFIKFRTALQKQFNKLAKSGTLYISEVSRDDIWDNYLSSFPEGSNPIFRERTEHDCQCCKQFVRYVGRVVGNNNGKLSSVWDIKVGGAYQVVADKLKELNEQAGIGNLFLHNEPEIGKAQTIENNEKGDIVWDHFHQVVPAAYYKRQGIGELKGKAQDNRKSLSRSIKEITDSAVDTVLELISQKSIYRGEEHKHTVQLLKKVKIEYGQAKDKNLYLWDKSVELGSASTIRSTVIGTLLTDLSKDVELEVAVKKFEDKVAPSNYKRSKALVTPRMLEEAKVKTKELGLESSLLRRLATAEDISVNDVLYADQSVQPVMENSVFDLVKTSKSSGKTQDFSKIQEVSVERFVQEVLPTAKSIELLLENSLESHLMTLVAPANYGSPNITKWDNNFTWSYNGDVADSDIKQRVKSAGGDVTGDLRFSIKWNDTATNDNDLDAHCLFPDSTLIDYSNKHDCITGCELDIDIMNPNGQVAVENITFPDRAKMENGKYKFIIHNFEERSGRNWEAQIEFDNEIFDYSYEGGFNRNQKQHVATVELKNGVFSLTKEGMKSSTSSKEVWGLTTKEFHKVNMVMNSPNHWEGQSVGNKHLFFILEGCKNPDKVRGFYNEYLCNDLQPHRKVFELLANELKAEYNDNQLSGVGISSTLDKEVVLKVSGTTTRMIKVKF